MLEKMLSAHMTFFLLSQNEFPEYRTLIYLEVVTSRMKQF